MFSLFIPLYTSFSIDESIRSSGSSHLRYITSFLHPYLHLTKPVQNCRSFSNLFFDIAVMFWTICYNSLPLTILMTRKVVSVDNMVHNVLIVQVFVKWNNHHSKFHQRGSVARSVHQVLYPLLCFLYSFYVFSLHLIFTLLELSSSYRDDDH